jgi:CheY-like chemotaxis protein
LSITQKLVEKLGGTIAVSSEVGIFTAFEVQLPYHGVVIDLSPMGQKLSDTTIVIIDPSERFATNFCMDDEFMPICPSLVQKVGLDVVRCPNFNELSKKLSRRQHVSCEYVAIVHQDVEEQIIGRDRTESLLGRDKIIWFTSGLKIPASPNLHFKSLSGTFPSIIFDRITAEIERHQEGLRVPSSNAAKPEHAQSENPGGKSSSNQDMKQSKSYPRRNLRVLMAEDNLVNQKVLKKVLSRLGVSHVDIVDNGLKAVEKTEEVTYDLILMDVDMPVMDGFEACERIVAKGSNPPVVFVTAHAMTDYQQKATEVGGDGFISKPFEIDKINEILSSLPA